MDGDPHQVTRGVRALRRLLRTQTFDLRGLDEGAFRRWLDGHLARWQNDPVFVQRVRIRDLRRSHDRLKPLEAEYLRASDAYHAVPVAARLKQLELELMNADKAIAGLTAALERVGRDKRPSIRQKLMAFRSKRETLRAEHQAASTSSPERQAYARAGDCLRRFRSEIGLDQEMAHLRSLQQRQGQRSDRSGKSFEQVAQTLTETLILPDLVRHPAARRNVRVLHGVTLGASRVELDQVVVRLPSQPGRPVDVLAVIEAKRNLNDVAHGFRQRQQNLSWLTGAADGYFPPDYRTTHFPSEVFDREAVHREQGEEYRFARRSFSRFRGDPATGFFLDCLYFITRPGPMWGISAGTLALISNHAATAEDWRPEDEAYLQHFWSWCQKLACFDVETPDVLTMYAASPRRARQILLIERPIRREGPEPP